MTQFNGYPRNLINSKMEVTLSWDLPPVKNISISNGNMIIYTGSDASGAYQVKPEVTTTYTLTWTDLITDTPSSLAPVTIVVSGEVKSTRSAHNFSPEREDQFYIEENRLLQLGLPQVIGSTEKRIGINNYSFNKCTERYPEVNNPLDVAQFEPGMKDIRIPLYHFDSGILLDFDIESPFAAFAPSPFKEVYNLTENESGQPRSLGLRLAEVPPYRMVGSYYYQSVLDDLNTHLSEISNPDGPYREWTAYRLHSTYTINPRTGKVLFPDGEYGLWDSTLPSIMVGTDAENPSFWANSFQKIQLSGSESVIANYDNRLKYTYSFDFEFYGGVINLNFWIDQTHYVVNLTNRIGTGGTLPSAEVYINDVLDTRDVRWQITTINSLPFHTLSVYSGGVLSTDGIFSTNPFRVFLKETTKEIFSEDLTQVYGNWFVKRKLSFMDQSRFANWVGYTSFATQAYLESWEALLKTQIKNSTDAGEIATLKSTLKGLRWDTAQDLEFPESRSESIPENLVPDWAAMAPADNQIYASSSIQVDVSNSRVMTALSFDEHRPLPILVMGSVTMSMDLDPISFGNAPTPPPSGYPLPKVIDNGVQGAFFYLKSPVNI